MSNMYAIHNLMWATYSERMTKEDWLQLADNVYERFYQLAKALPDGAFIGIELGEMLLEEQVRFLVFSDVQTYATQEDFSWIFSEAHCEAAQADAAESFFDASRVVYRIERFESWDTIRMNFGRDEEGDRRAQSVLMGGTFLEELHKAQGRLRILLGGNGCAVALISLPEEMSLKMRALVGDVFIHTAAVRADGAQEIELDPHFLYTFDLFRLLDSYLRLCGVKEEELGIDSDAFLELDGEDIDEDIDEEDEQDEPLPLKDMELSVRAFNCLKRAGYQYAQELFTLTDEEFMRIRNLGRKSCNEVKRKLAELFPGKEFAFSTEEALAEAPQPLKPSQMMRKPTKKLEELIGLDEVKEQVQKIVAFTRMQKAMEAQGGCDVPLVLNMAFLGNPGTAKTTVARILAEILADIGLLKSPDVVEVGRSGLVGRYCGHTAEKVKEVFAQAKGKLLFIDEAYSLLDWYKNGFGDEAISTIVQEMENHRHETVVIFAGYPEEMEAFFDRNPGLRSRVPFTIRFPDYTPDEMVRITELEVSRRGFSIDAAALGRVASICERACGDTVKGNGRFCRNLAEKAILQYAVRVYGGDTPPEDAAFILTEEDFTLPDTPEQPVTKAPIGFIA